MSAPKFPAIPARERNAIWSGPYRTALFVLLLGYLAFIPVGPYPIPVLGTKLDIVFGVGLLVLLLPNLPMALSSQPRAVTISLLVYLTATLLSVATSDARVASLNEWLVTLGYATVAYIGSAVFAMRGKEIRSWLLLFAAITAGAIFFLLASTKTHARFAFGPAFGIPIQEGLRYVDPNHTGIGLMLTLMVAIPLLRAPESYHDKLRWLLTALAGGLVATAGLVTLSRTALVASAGGALIAIIALALIGIMRPRFRHYLWTSGATLVAIAATVALLLLLGWSYMPMVLERLAHAGEDKARLQLIEESFAAYRQTPKSLIFGHGFMTLNPHNEYLRNLASSGVLAIAAFLVFLASVFRASISPLSGRYVHDLGKYTLFFFVVIAIMFYPLVKIFWVAILFLLLFGLEQRALPATARTHPTSIRD